MNIAPTGQFLAILLTALISGCTPNSNSIRGSCIADALRKTGLSNGVAIFTESDSNTGKVATSFHGEVRLATNHPYPMASLTKLVVAAEIKNLIESDIIELDAKIKDLLPDYVFDESTRQVTVRHLLQHSAGFGHPNALDPLLHRPDDMLKADCEAAGRYLVGLPIHEPPGEFTRYSNTGYCLLAEILLRTDTERLTPRGRSMAFRRVLKSGYGGSGGWIAPLPAVYSSLKSTLPLENLARPTYSLPDGSWYGYGWRWWPEPHSGAPWTHTGRFQGLLAIALTDGRDQLLVAHFNGDPIDYLSTAELFGKQAWACMESTSVDINYNSS